MKALSLTTLSLAVLGLSLSTGANVDRRRPEVDRQSVRVLHR